MSGLHPVNLNALHEILRRAKALPRQSTLTTGDKQEQTEPLIWQMLLPT
jgi:hypothetical protein